MSERLASMWRALTEAPADRIVERLALCTATEYGGTDIELLLVDYRLSALLPLHAGDPVIRPGDPAWHCFDHQAEVLAGGAAAVNQDVTNQVTSSLLIAELIAVPLTALLLLLAFGSVVAALLPLAVGGVAILGTFAELAVLGEVTDVSIFAINLTTALGLGLGIDYALFMVSRFREQLAAGQSVPEAVRSAGPK